MDIQNPQPAAKAWFFYLQLGAGFASIVGVLALLGYNYVYGRRSADRTAIYALEEMTHGMGTPASTTFISNKVTWKSGSVPYWDYEYTMTPVSGAARNFSIYVFPGSVTRPVPTAEIVMQGKEGHVPKY